MSEKIRLPERLLNPPKPEANNKTYEVIPTACQYCVVGCGYEAHTWKGNGDCKPPNLEQAHWVSPAMAGIVRIDGVEKNAAVVPDPKCSMNKGNHSPRGGTQGRNLVFSQETTYLPDSTRERITTPYLRTSTGYVPITNDQADELLSELVKSATGYGKDGSGNISFKTPGALGIKLYEYQYLENTFAATALFFQLIGTPNVAFHDRPSVANNTQGFEDSGIDPHGYAYDDIWDSDVIFLAGNNPYESQSVFFMQYMAGKRIIVLDPRRTATADYAEKTGGLHLQPKALGADTLILNSLAKYIKDKQIEDPTSWPSRLPYFLMATNEDLKKDREDAQNLFDELHPNGYDPRKGPDLRRKARYLMSTKEYFAFLDQLDPTDGHPLYSLERASEISGIEREKLQKAAQFLASSFDNMVSPTKRKVSLIFEKGLIWGYNYQNTGAFANLGLLLGSVLRPSFDGSSWEGKSILGVTGRAGGHQKGWATAKSYPFVNASDEFDAGDGKPFRINNYFDAHLVGTKVAPTPDRLKVSKPEEINLLWVIGSNAVGQMGNAAAKWAAINKRRDGEESFPSTLEEALANWQKRMENNGLVVVQQDIYPNPTTNHADLIIPASGWGEENFTRYTGERRLRLYGKFQDPPAYRDDKGQLHKDKNGDLEIRCRPDWKIFQKVILSLLTPTSNVNGLTYNQVKEWDKGSSKVFEDMANTSNRKGLLKGIVDYLKDNQLEKAYDLLLNKGTEGIILPTTYDPYKKELKEYKRTEVKPKWNSGACYAFVKADWLEIKDHFEANQVKGEEFYICNGRVNELWNSMFTNLRNETIRQRWPDNLPGTIVEIHPDDAHKIKDIKGNIVGVKNGDLVEISCEDIHLGTSPGKFTAVVSLQNNFLPQGVVFAMFSYPVNKKLEDQNKFPYREFTTDGYVNNVSTGYVDPINPIAAVKYARGKITTLEKHYHVNPNQHEYLGLSYQPRNITFPMNKINSELERLDWKMRELIVQKGLVRARVHPDFIKEMFREPDELLSILKSSPSMISEPLRDNRMSWEPYDRWEDPQKSFVLEQWLASLPKPQPMTPEQAMRNLLKTKQATAQAVHSRVPVDQNGTTLNNLFATENYEDILKFLREGKLRLGGKPLIVPTKPDESGFYQAITNGVMQGVFSQEEIGIVERWIKSLPQTSPNPPVGSLSFARDIRPSFRDFDVQEMANRFDLSKYEDVKTFASKIYDRLKDGSMPCDAPWPSKEVEKFKKWMDEGMNP